MTYREAIKQECEKYAQDEKVRFIGYNTLYGSRMYGTLDAIPAHRCIESPVAENLMVGMAIGMALEGYKPVVCFERHDFIMLAMDAIVNHVDKLPYMSGQQFKLPIIIRAIVGASAPINAGPMHTQNHSMGIGQIVKNTPVYEPMTQWEMKEAWQGRGCRKTNPDRFIKKEKQSGAVIIIERRDFYDNEISP